MSSLPGDSRLPSLNVRVARATRRFASWLLLVSLLFSAVGVQAKIGVAYQMLLGNPSGATSDAANYTNYLIQRDQYAMSYNDATGQANWVSWNLTAGDIGGAGRSSSFFVDTTLPSGFYRVLTTDYSGSGYDRGHMCPSGDRTVSRADNDATFYMSNMVPQTPDNNQGVWNNFESYCRSLATSGYEVLIISGPSAFGTSRIPSNAAAIPGNVWKIVLAVPTGDTPIAQRITTSTRVIAIKIPNISGVRSDPWTKYVTSIAAIEAETGYQFLTELPANVRSVLRTVVDGQPVTGLPIVSVQPVPQTTAVGGSATFSVTATGDAPLSYQWFKDEELIPDATSSTLTLTNVQAADAGYYQVVVTNNAGTATSNSVALVLTGLPPVIAQAPVARVVGAGDTASFAVTVTGSPPFTYTWRKDGAAISGNASASTATLILPNAQAAAVGSYDVVVANSVSTVTSSAAALTVLPAAPLIATQPAARSVAPGGTAAFTVVATGTEPLSYQWRKGGTAISGNATATAATLVLTNVQAADAGSYDVVVTNSQGDATSTAAALSINATAQGVISYSGGTYTQDFNSLPSSGTFTLSGVGPHRLDATPISATNAGGWWLAKYVGSGNALFNVSTGTGTSGSVYSFGSSNASDRALGSVASGTTISRFGMVLRNNTAVSISQFTLSYTGEQWRNSGEPATQSLAFEHGIGATDINSGTFTEVATLKFTSPVATSTAAALDGNAATNRTLVTATVTGLSWGPGETLVLRWTDINDGGADHGLAIDDVSFTTPVGSGPVAPAVSSTAPAHNATGVATTVSPTITFNQAVTVSEGWFTLTSAANGPLAATVSGGPTTYTLSLPSSFAIGDTITLTVKAGKVTDQATGALALAADQVVTFTTAAPVAPTIATQPQAKSASAGSNVTFTVAANGTAPFTYQWRKGGTALAGNATASSASLTLTNVQAADAGSYDVVVTNAVGSATSSAATLSVTAAATGVVRWDFSTATPTTGLPANLSGGTVTQGNNNGTTALLTETSASGTSYTGASSSFNAGAAARIGALSQGTGGSAYFEFSLTPASGYKVRATGLAFGSRSTGTGPQAYAVYTSVDNYATPVASGTFVNNSAWVWHTPTFSAVTGAAGSAVTFRLYGYNGTGSPATSTANWRIDDLQVTVDAVSDVTPLQAWRQTNFGTTANSGTAADNADPDGDGVANLLEFSLGLNPNSPAYAALPAGAIESGAFVLRFTRAAAGTDLIVESSTDLATWSAVTPTVVSSDASGVSLAASIPATGAKGFLRLRSGSVSSVPVGFMNIALTGGATKAFGVPLEDPTGPANGIKAGRIGALTATSLTHTAAGWTPGALADASAPWVVRLTSGNAAGRLIGIAGNTATTLQLLNVNLATLGVAAGDAFELVAADTLGTLFGASVLQGGTSTANADNVQIRSGGAAVTYFHDTARGYWRRSTATASADNVALLPGTGLTLVRRGATKTFTVTGRVLGTAFRQSVANAGVTTVTHGFPTDTTLGALALQSRLSGWRSGTTAAADQVFLHNGSAWVGYVFNGSAWVALSGGAAADAVAVPAGALLLIQRPGAQTGSSELILSRPY